MNKQILFNTLIILFLILATVQIYIKDRDNIIVLKITRKICVKQEVDSGDKLTLENVYAYLKKSNVKHVDIVMKQVIHETGWLKSNSCINNNNLFGLYSTKHRRYMKFDNWKQSVDAYKSMIQYRFKGNESYYRFLKRIGYAKDRNYIKKLKKINKLWKIKNV